MSGDGTSTEKRAEMREVYLEHRTVESVSRLCDVAWRTAERYRVEDNWDKALERVDKLAEDIAVKKIGKRRADTIRIAHASIIKMAKDLDSKTELPFSAQDVDRMARLIELLSGDPDTRSGISNTPINAEEVLLAFGRLSGADQARILRQLRGDLVEPTQPNA